MEKVIVLGIAGSPRRGNTEWLVQQALKAAESVKGVETQFISLVGMKLAGCDADYMCFRTATEESPCPSVKEDEGNEIFRAMLKADGIILGSPVYYGGITGQMKCLLDRTMGLEAMGMKLRRKVGGALTVGYTRNGGQETTLWALIQWMMIQDMIVVGVGPDRPKTSVGAFWGGAATQGFPYPVPSPTREGRKAAQQDEVGLASVVGMGKRVAEVARMIKFANANLPETDLAWPLEIEPELMRRYREL